LMNIVYHYVSSQLQEKINYFTMINSTHWLSSPKYQIKQNWQHNQQGNNESYAVEGLQLRLLCKFKFDINRYKGKSGGKLDNHPNSEISKMQHHTSWFDKF
jgi:hypothetical protein